MPAESSENITYSRSQKRRQALDLLELGQTLVEMPKLPSGCNLSEKLIAEINICKNIKANGGRRRQLHFIGKLLRSWHDESPEDVNKLQELIYQNQKQKNSDNKILAASQKWANEIVAELLVERDKTLLKFLDIYPRARINELQLLLAEIKTAPNKIKIVKAKLVKLIIQIIINS